MKKNINFVKAAVVVAFLMAGVTANAQRTVYLWPGDFRVGLNVCVDHALQGFDVKAPTGYTVEKNMPALAQPGVGLYYGMEKDVSGNFAFGFESTASLQLLSSSATIKNVAGNSFDYSFSATGINVYEGIYLSYFLTDELALNGGVGLDESLWFNGKAEASPADGAPGCQFGDGMMVGMGVALGAQAGITYYFNDSFFVKANLNFATSPFYGSGTISDMMGDDWSDVWGNNSNLTVNPGESIRLGLSTTIGVKW